MLPSSLPASHQYLQLTEYFSRLAVRVTSLRRTYANVNAVSFIYAASVQGLVISDSSIHDTVHLIYFGRETLNDAYRTVHVLVPIG